MVTEYQSSIFFAEFHGKRRSFYRQLDGKTELADSCTCRVIHGYFSAWNSAEAWPRQVEFIVIPDSECPIDEHRLKIVRAEAA